MKKMMMAFLSVAVAGLLTSAQAATPNMGLVNFKTCVETSKVGKKEQENFDAMRKQMEDVLTEKEKTLTELNGKFSDEDYLDSLSPEAEAELKHKFRTLSQEFSQHQQQFYQMLNQANFKIVQMITEQINEASKTVAKNKKLDLIMNDENAFFSSSAFDVTKDVVAEMDKAFDAKENK